MPQDVSAFVKDAMVKVSDFGINLYRNKNAAEQFAPTMRNAIPFRNFQWVAVGKLARCAQPGYAGAVDTVQEITDTQLRYLKRNNIKNIISLNHCHMKAESVTLLRNNGIQFTHYLVADFTAVGLQRLGAIAGQIGGNGATLIYCGYGEGRTGTAVSAWAVRHILERDRQFFSDFNWLRLALFLKFAFGTETIEQYQDIGDYIKSLAARPTRGAPANQNALTHPKYVNKLTFSSAQKSIMGDIISGACHNQAVYNADRYGDTAVADMFKEMDKFISEKVFKRLRQRSGPFVTLIPPSRPGLKPPVLKQKLQKAPSAFSLPNLAEDDSHDWGNYSDYDDGLDSQEGNFQYEDNIWGNDAGSELDPILFKN